MSFLLPSVGGDAKLSFEEESGNQFLLSKEEELARVTNAAAAKTKDRDHAHTKYSLHNISVRAAAGDRKEAARSLEEKIKECAAWKMDPRATGPQGLTVLKSKGLSPHEFKSLALRVLTLDLSDAELSEVVFMFGDDLGAIDGVQFTVHLLKLSKRAKAARQKQEARKNFAAWNGKKTLEEDRAISYLAAKPSRVDYDFDLRTEAKVRSKLSEWGVTCFEVSGQVRVVGPAGYRGFQENLRMTPTELRDQVQRTFGVKLPPAQVGCLCVLLLEQEEAEKERALRTSAASAGMLARRHKNEAASANSSSSSSSSASSASFASPGSAANKTTPFSSTAADGGAVGGADGDGRGQRAARLEAALRRHPCLAGVVLREGEVVVDGRAVFGLLREASRREKDRVKRDRAIASLRKEVEAQDRAEAFIFEAPSEDQLPKSNLAASSSSSSSSSRRRHNLSSSSSSVLSTGLSLPSSLRGAASFLPPHLQASLAAAASPSPPSSAAAAAVVSSRVGGDRSAGGASGDSSARAGGGVGGGSVGSLGGALASFDEGAQAEGHHLNTALTKLARASATYNRNQLGPFGLTPLSEGAPLNFVVFQRTLKQTLGVKLSIAQVEAVAEHIAREASLVEKAGALGCDAFDSAANGKVNCALFLKLFFLLRNPSKAPAPSSAAAVSSHLSKGLSVSSRARMHGFGAGGGGASLTMIQRGQALRGGGGAGVATTKATMASVQKGKTQLTYE